MARVLETRHPGMQERISSAIELAGLGGADAERASAELIRLLTQDAASDWPACGPSRSSLFGRSSRLWWRRRACSPS
jgi:hypothetical protein